ncbi:hypothetical protein F2Q68_00011765 [Brassica cretica]|uniref:Uncharacterized protein n=1 Tax=Brassica cretica TaxID=69181 RepID=A0A8S9KLG4_BRACR|nr:hypothetical protein F2Q68_00011765 [Brassica cretica]
MVPKVGYHSYTEDTGVEVSRTGRDQVELAGRADSRDGRTRRRAQPHDGSARRRADRRSSPRERPGCVALRTSLQASLGVVSPWKRERPWIVALASRSGRGVSR